MRVYVRAYACITVNGKKSAINDADTHILTQSYARKYALMRIT